MQQQMRHLPGRTRSSLTSRSRTHARLVSLSDFPLTRELLPLRRCPIVCQSSSVRYSTPPLRIGISH
eukprot:901718-Pleurochrysis_carterae.AAC.4